MPVETTAMKKRPSKRGSRARRARSQTSRSSSTEGSLTPTRRRASPFPDVDVGNSLTRGATSPNTRFEGGMRTRWIGRCVKILLVSALLSAASPGSAFDAGSPACESPGHRQFDFWAGAWDAYDSDAPGTRSARVRVDVILDGCALREIYEGADGLVGQSFSIYDASRKVWHQTWVTNRGQLLALEGEYRDGRMTLRATETTPTGP